MTAIEWVKNTDGSQGKTWNPIVGCSVVSPGCTNCYAMTMAARLERMGLERYRGLTKPSKAGPVWTGETRLVDEALTEPLRRRKPTMWFVNSMSDLFHESVPDAWIDRVFAVMALCPQHTFQVLTKRSARMRAYTNDPATPGRIARFLIDRCLIAKDWPMTATAWPVQSIGDIDLPDDVTIPWPLPNVWLGVSTEDQRRADERVPDLLATPAAVRFVSAEPLLGPIDFRSAWHGEDALDCECWGECAWCEKGYPALYNCQRGQGDWMKGRSGLDWIIVGGESGPGARPMHPAWAREIRDQCAAAGVPYFFKQWGAWGPTHPDWQKAVPTVMADDGTLYRPSDIAYPDGPRYGEAVRADHHRAHLTNIYRVGKATAGRLLDGVEHNGMPEVRV